MRDLKSDALIQAWPHLDELRERELEKEKNKDIEQRKGHGQGHGGQIAGMYLILNEFSFFP